MRHPLIALFVVPPLMTAPLAHGQTVAFQIEWNGPTPNNVEADDGGAGTTLALNNANKIFTGALDPGLKPGDASFRKVRVVVKYGDGQETFPVQIGHGIKVVKLASFRPATALVCDEATVTLAESSTTDPDEGVKRYVLARDLYMLAGQNQCYSYQLKRVKKAFFDRSYALTQIRDYYRIDDDAINAYRPINADYVDNYVNEAKAHQIKIVNDEKRALASAGDVKAAAALNTGILSAVSQSASLATAVETRQRLPIAQLRADGLFYRNRLF